ncbi:hypothetical protein P3X46_023284 [Hevea brasiliensis]|uniref:RING-type E3 ubiquitin transferase n=1 Tax=Hevea brasiliensis TaxID=3981 RepID=A0ABQ9LAH0_HEVBR|nr:putative RING-H2 finger protein ATL35 [Hevea brasiliensis]KAJ9163635.1 hypothetical protein P3X46_023284 [Hevea brasiliensis]
MPTTYQCEAWLGEAEDMDDSLAEAVLFIHIYSHIIPFDSTEEGTSSAGVTITISKEFQVKREYLIHDSTSWSTIMNMLSEMNMPLYVQPIMIMKIAECAQESRNLERKVIPMFVHLKTIQSTNSSTGPDEADAFMESFDSQSLRFMGASRSAIEALEKVKVNKGSWEQCVICLEDISIGMEATRMPCSHIYHGSCIRNWLENSNLCPLCRFQVAS